MRTPRLPVVDWSDAPADLNGLVRFAENEIWFLRVCRHISTDLYVGIWYSFNKLLRQCAYYLCIIVAVDPFNIHVCCFVLNPFFDGMKEHNYIAAI